MIACLVLAHGAPRVLGQSLPLLQAAGWDVFVHLDQKVDYKDYAQALPDDTGFRLLSDPVRVFWGGYSMVEAELRLIRTALDHKAYDKFILLSDDCFPILPPVSLNAHFANSEDQATAVIQPEHSPFYLRYKGFFCYDHSSINPRSLEPADMREIDEDLEKKIAEIAVLRRIGKKKIDIYYGSQFWALTRKSAEYVLGITGENLHLRKSFEYSALPDETMIQSILGFSNRLHDFNSGPVYADFSGGGPRVISNPSEIPLDFQAPHAFVRKIAPNAGDLLTLMRERLLEGKTILGSPPGERQVQHCVFIPGFGERLLIRLAAPLEEHHKDWNGIETFWGRCFRWTASERISWSVEMDKPSAGVIRFVITTVIGSKREWLAGCCLRWGDVTKPVQIQGGELYVEFDANRSSASEIVLETPQVRSPRETSGLPDDRKLGLSIAT